MLIQVHTALPVTRTDRSEHLLLACRDARKQDWFKSRNGIANYWYTVHEVTKQQPKK
jgi:hypothetical protein